jgi:hypothetical protein
MLRHLIHRHGDRFGACGLTEDVSGARVDGQPAPEVREIEGSLTVPAVRSSDQGKQGLVLRDRDHRAIAKRPAQRGEISAEHTNFTKKWL